MGLRYAVLLGLGTACAAGTESPAPASSALSAARCPVPSMTDLYAGVLPPGPADSFTSSCVVAKHDAIMVLGCPNLPDGSASLCQQARADIAVALHDAGYGDKFIVSGGAVHTPYVEADTLHDLLVARGIASSDIERERLARHTDENIYRSSRIMSERGWQSAFVVSDSPAHFLFTGLCDSNCCVRLGRLTLVKLPPRDIVVGHYVLYPAADHVSDAECTTIRAPWKAMCFNLESRNACRDRLRL